MSAEILREGDHVQHTAGVVVIAGEFSRAVITRCETCPSALPLRLIADEPIDDAECDELLTAYLEALGWHSAGAGDMCPTCAGTLAVG
jgi:hypothetical protein